MHPVQTHDLSTYDLGLLLDGYRKMKAIRLFEEKAIALSLKNQVPGMIHVSIGQEASAAAVGLALRQDDFILSTHRGHGHVIAKGGDLSRMMAEMCGRETGYNGGRGGSMHIMNPEIGVLGANGIVGGGLPMATGVGYSIQVRGTDQVCVVFFGEGAVAEGAFHESLNLAAVWNLPVIYVCENNLYAELTHVSLHLKAANVADFAQPHGVPGHVVDGTDLLATYDVVAAAVTRARHGGGPTLVECKTYRWHGHFVGDPQAYRTKDEVQAWMAKDPVVALRDHLTASGVVQPRVLDGIDAELQAAVEAAAEFALESPHPRPEDVTRHVYQP